MVVTLVNIIYQILNKKIQCGGWDTHSNDDWNTLNNNERVSPWFNIE